VVQGALKLILEPIFEADFCNGSYGYRPRRTVQEAVARVDQDIVEGKTRVIDVDLAAYFDSVDHEWLLRMVAHRVADRRMLRLIGRWLRASVMEGLEWRETLEGTPQGAGISPLLANIFLHYALDLWVQHWRKTPGHGRVSIVRYADDFVMGFQRETDAREMLVALKERLGKFKLALHGDKTRLIEFGKLVAEHRRARNTRRPGTFSFLGFTHYCGWSRDGRFVVKRRTEGRRVSRKLQEVQAELRRRMHTPVQSQHRWLCSVLRGHDAYYGLPSNWPRLDSFHDAVRRRWYCVLRRRSQRMGAIQRVAGTLPLAFDPDYSPARGFLGPRRVTFGRSRVRESRTLGSVGAKAKWLSYPTNPTQTSPRNWLGRRLRVTPLTDRPRACGRSRSSSSVAPDQASLR